MQRRARRIYLGIVCGVAGFGLAALAGCMAASGSQFQDLVNQLLGGSTTLASTTLTIRIVNEAGTGINEELKLEIDGVEQTFTCSATQHVCDVALLACPQQVIAISERRVDTGGYFQGGRNFNGGEESFNFVRGEFECGQIILYRFTDTVAEAFVY
jgi:hypothetical protein